MVVGCKFGSLGRDSLKDIGNKRIQDGHSLVSTRKVSNEMTMIEWPGSRDTGVRVDLFEDFVDV